MSDSNYKPMLGWGASGANRPPVLHPDGYWPVVMQSPCPYSQWQGEIISSSNCTVTFRSGTVTAVGRSSAGITNTAFVRVFMLYTGLQTLRFVRTGSDTYNYAVISVYPQAGQTSIQLDSVTPVGTLSVPYYRYHISIAFVVMLTSHITISISLL